MASIADLFFSLRGDDSQLQVDVSKAGNKAGQTLGQGMASGLKQNATKIAAGAGAAIGVFVAGATGEFAKFQQGMNEVFTLLPGISADAMGQMQDDVKAFSKETGKLPEEVIPALYAALSAGVPPDNVFDFMRTANKAAVGGVASTTDAIGLLSAVTKGYGDTTKEATARASDLAFTTVKLGQTTFPELSASMGKAVPLAAALNLRQEELFASAATLTGVTGNTAEVMTQLKAVFTSLIKTNPQMSAGLKEMGFESGAAAIESLGLKGTLDGLQKVTGGNTQQLAEMLGSSEALTAALALTGAQSEKFVTNLAEMETSTGATDTAFKRMDAGVTATSNKMLATLKVWAIDVGDQLKDLGPAFTLFGPTAGRALGAGLGGLAGLAAPALISGLAGLLPLISGALGTLGSAAGGLIAAAIPIGMALLQALLIAALVAAVVFLINNPEIVGKIADFVGSVVSNIVKFLSGLAGALVDVFGKAFGAVVRGAPGFVGEVAKFILLLPFRILDLQVKLLEFFVGIFTSVLGKLPGFIGDVVGFLFSIPGRLVDLGGKIVGAIIDGMISLPGKLFDVVAGAFRNLRIDIGPFHISSSGVTIDLPKIDFPSFAVGSPSVPRDMLAMVHAREMIIPAAQSDAIRAGQAVVSAGDGGGGSPTPGAVTIEGGITFNNQYMAASDAEARSFARTLWSYLEDEGFRRGRTLQAVRGGS